MRKARYGDEAGGPNTGHEHICPGRRIEPSFTCRLRSTHEEPAALLLPDVEP